MPDNDRFDPLDDRVIQDPYPLYDRFRSRDPIHLGAAPFPSVPNCHYAFRYDTVQSLLRDSRLGRTRPGGDERTGPREPRWVRRLGRRMVLFNDPPEQIRIRGLLAAAFSQDYSQGLRPLVEEVADGLLAEIPDGEPFDAVSALAEPLPVLVIARALGLPPEDSGLIRQWSNNMVAVTDPRGSDVPVEKAARSALQLLAYLRDLLPERRRNPGEDLLSRLLLASRNGEQLTEDEVLANAMLFLSAGHETTVGLLGNGILALVSNPWEMDWLRQERRLLPNAVEELLRYDSPIQMTFRFAHEPLSLEGRAVEQGDAVAAVLGAANRDPAVYEKPHRLDIGRRRARHLAFGAGSHTCMGPGLARMEAEVALDRLLDRFPTLELAGEVERRKMVAFRSLIRLPVASSGRS